MNEPLAKYAKPRIDDARIARQWSIVSRPTRKRSSALLVLASLVVAMTIASVATWRIARKNALEIVAQKGVTDVESKDSESTIALADGSRVSIGPRSHLVVEETSNARTRVALLSGTADFDIRHDPARSFIVVAHGISIVDTGTRFHVEYTQSGHDVRVQVIEGSVRVERGASPPSSLMAGESWASGGEDDRSVASAAPTGIVAVDAGHVTNPTPVVDSLARFSELAERDPNAAFAVLGEGGFSRAITRANAKQLFELGNVARLSGHPAQAADAFDALRTRYRDDPRAGLAAMQLARLREDTLHDARGAEEALRDAIALAPDVTLREDAEARRIGVLEAMNNMTACIAARDAYLAKYPSGIHRASVEKRCGGK